MRQTMIDYRRPAFRPEGYETTDRRSCGSPADAQMLARHQYLTEQRSGTAGRQQELELLRLRQRLLELGG